ncbi:MAG: hypothetical protein AAGE52_04065 [Myxococcota bacterium]
MNETTRDEPTRDWQSDLLVAIAALLTFARGVPRALMTSWDDQRFLVEFEPVQSISVDHLVALWSEPHFEAYHPLHLMSYWLDVPWVGPNGPVIHGVSLALFVGALLLVRRVFLAWGLGRVGALLATLAYGLHPVQVEAVTWATGRKEIVALLLASACILLHERSRLADKGPWERDAWLSRAAYVGAALAKTTVLPLPLVLIARDVLLGEKPLRTSIVRQVPAFLLGLGLGVAVVQIWHDNEMIRAAPEGLGPIALVSSTVTHHLGTALIPLWTSPVYPIHRVMADFAWWDALGPLALALAVWRGNAPVRFAAIGFLVLLAPVSNIWPLYFEVQDRYLCLPLLPLAFLFGALADAVQGSGKSALTVVVAAFAAISVIYQGVWSSDLSLWKHAAQTHPESFYAWMKVGELERNEGDFGAALQAYDRAIENEPLLRLGHAARFQTFALLDEERHSLSPSRAVEFSQRYVQVADDSEGLRTVAGDMVVAGYRDAALIPLGRAMELTPMSPERIERAALSQLRHGNEWLVRFYVERMSRPPFDPALRRFIPAENE